MHTSNLLKISLALSLFCFFCLSCQPSGSENKQGETTTSGQAENTLNVYTYYQSIEDNDLTQRFANLTGATAKFNVMDPKALTDQFISGAINPDLIILDDLSLLLQAKEAGLLQPFSTADMEENIPSKYKDNDGYWVAMGKSGMVVVYHKDKIKEGQIRTYSDLTKAEYKGRLLISSIEEGTNRQLLASMIAAEGETATENFAKALLANQAKAPSGTDRDVIEAVANGEADLGIVDIASVLKFRYSGNPDEFKLAESLSMVYPVNKDGVTYLSFRFIAVPKNTGDRATALRFAEYLTNDSAQQAMSAGSFIFPTNPMVIPTDFLIDQGGYKDLGTDLNVIGQLDDEARAIAESLGWE